ncbi:hypothetical protein PICMEDRAFT_31347 [Pichia membranifaciens NRRL Y-2026]|uniref:Trafficking protein particle complex subunit BET3 n=1 Tax=Pichia membranifaciens NRRL Y-2026 TaxID=763406 RepID=A0A1E3NQA4_9ASCO|nr:hypothetical protein PICMEDRAFT_31347 [Pichia membranifaciens NRRL Y-2026]ODQ48226.1 hypothetical protein PICMEDRAFT_31347 [Pichia membranifaciens NRRL Y-2026]
MSKQSKHAKQAKQLGEDIWKSQTVKINSELFTLTYGSLVAQICREEKFDYEKINNVLFDMGRNIGVRLIEEFLSKTSLERCSSFKETSEAICKIGFKMFLNVVPNVTYWSADGRTFQLTLLENPLSDFVELPDDIDEGSARKELWYSNILCGVLKGALEMVQLDCQVWFVSDVLRGDASTDIKIRLVQVLKDEIPDGDE